MSEQRPTIIVRRVKKVAGGGHHGGSWKVAYADFVTAMMAFFLLMWLINTTSPEQKRGIAEYFAPASVSATTSGSASDFPMSVGSTHAAIAPCTPSERLSLSTGSGQALLSGDASDGEFQMDESEDGVAISAVWHAVVNPADCGRRLQGTRRPAEDRPASEVLLNFELSKVPGWQ